MTDFTPDRHRYPDAGAAGPAAATTPIRIVEYGDFECPGCQMLAPVLKELVDESNGRISLVFRHFPVFEIHPFALTAALAAEASGHPDDLPQRRPVRRRPRPGVPARG